MSVTTGHERALRVFRAAPDQPLTASEVADAMVTQGHDFGPPGRTAVARAALVTAILTRLASPERGPLTATTPLDTEPRWCLPAQTPTPSDTPPPPTATPTATPTPTATQILEATFHAMLTRRPSWRPPWHSQWRALPPRDRVKAAVALVLLILTAALLVLAVG